MIISASRRTDIPNYYAEWFINRLREGYVFVRNPFNPQQIQKIELTAEVVDGIVFWTKNPEPMLSYLPALSAFPYYFQYTLNAYESDIEPAALPSLQRRLETFRKLSETIGHKRVIWRYDPIFLTEKYTEKWHVETFEKLAVVLKAFTSACVFSFIDLYDTKRAVFSRNGIRIPTREEQLRIAEQLAKIAHRNNIRLNTCSESIDLSAFGIGHAKCIDEQLLSDISGVALEAKPDRNQRNLCGCVESIDIGAYNTCPNHCLYCYANYNASTITDNRRRYDVASPLCCDVVRPEDTVSIRTVTSLKVHQLKLF